MLSRHGSRVAASSLLSQRCFSTSRSDRMIRGGYRLVLGIETSCDDSCVALLSAPVEYTASNLGTPHLKRKLGPVGKNRSPPQTGPRVIASVGLRQDHSKTKGIHPLLAQHAHMANLPLAIQQCLEMGRVSQNGGEVDAIAVTQGPGMAGCLSVGLITAKALAAVWKKPLIPVHHMEAHALTPFFTEQEQDIEKGALKFPFLTLLLSGGHTMIVLVRGVGNYKILATTDDEAIGDALDKAAKLLAIPTDWMKQSPGASLEAFAAAYVPPEDPAAASKEEKNILTYTSTLKGIPMFSFSGLGSALKRQLVAMVDELQKKTPLQEDKSPQTKAQTDDKKAKSLRNGTVTGESIPLAKRQLLAKRFQSLAFDLIEDKLNMIFFPRRDPGVRNIPISMPPEWEKYRAEFESCKHLVVSGGVASNSELRRRLEKIWVQRGREGGEKEERRFLLFPPIKYCVDNAAMIANVGLLHYDSEINKLRDPMKDRLPKGGKGGMSKHFPTKESLSLIPKAKWSLEELIPPPKPLKSTAHQDIKDVIGMVHSWKALGRDVKEIREMMEDREKDVQEIREIQDGVFREAWGKKFRDSPTRGGEKRKVSRGSEGVGSKALKHPEGRGEKKALQDPEGLANEELKDSSEGGEAEKDTPEAEEGEDKDSRDPSEGEELKDSRDSPSKDSTESPSTDSRDASLQDLRDISEGGGDESKEEDTHTSVVRQETEQLNPKEEETQ